MDKKGVHSPKNIEEATIPAKGIASPVQTVACKDLSNSLMADTLPKSLRILPASLNITRTTEQVKLTKGFLLKRKKEKRIEQMIQNSLQKLLSKKTKEVISENPKPKPKTPDTEYSGSNDYGSEYNPSVEQFSQDPNKNDDSGMSFDFIELNNLDTEKIRKQ
ncbi:hypothetical protein H5410_004915 [Solanum commersonii]|uniref:Uncharacterized protein n=1 Tax=Solanum commersonii TaxID=4109 RepID=A0A9J6A566_SOLCO|nr:hypothetical protein H5410_004915 [Solanum commersonii]